MVTNGTSASAFWNGSSRTTNRWELGSIITRIWQSVRLDPETRFPYIGSPVDGRPGVRQFVHTPVLIYYRVNEAPNFVEVLHFWHGSRHDAAF